VCSIESATVEPPESRVIDLETFSDDELQTDWSEVARRLENDRRRWCNAADAAMEDGVEAGGRRCGAEIEGGA
jgi:hypothetical protein